MIIRIVIPIIILIGFGFGAATLMATAPELEPDTPQPIPTTIRVRDVTPETVTLRVHSQGSVTPSTESQLIPEVSGRVVWMSPKLVAGGYFEKGEPLVRVEPQDYNNFRERAKATLKRAEAEHEHATFEYSRQRSLAERRLTSRAQLENALRQARVAEAALADARAAYSQARDDVGRTELRAPFTGLVRNESVDIGQFVSRGSAIANIYASDQVEVRLPISDRQLAFLDIPIGARGELRDEQQPRVALSTEYAGKTVSWEGRIVRAEAAIDTASRMIYLVARVPAEEGEFPLSVGLFVRADIQGREADGVVVLPRTALRNDNQVLVVDESDRLHYRDIDLLRLYQNDLLIQAGLHDGERVCVSPLQTAIDGMIVNPVAAEADTARG
ncbi:MAG: efflux RND transporter periplasmic adaptor subunit [Pseudomonadota bacterium]